MQDLARRLRVKYGLTNNPTIEQIAKFRRLLDRFTPELDGDADKAGRKAASLAFPDFETMFYGSQGDTLETLLKLIDTNTETET